MDPYWVLIVEDDPEHVLLIKAVFAHLDANAHVVVARSAEEAIQQVRGPWQADDFGRRDVPDVIVLDINMPGIGGLGFLEWLSKAETCVAEIPVVVFTGMDDRALKDLCLQFGAREFEVKPSDFSKLVPLVQRVLDRWRPGKAKEESA